MNITYFFPHDLSMKPLSFFRVTSPHVATTDASHKTVRRRSSEVALVRDTVSGGAASAQLEDEVASLSRAERQKLLASGSFSVQVTANDALAMKADLVIPWQKMRVMRR